MRSQLLNLCVRNGSHYQAIAIGLIGLTVPGVVALFGWINGDLIHIIWARNFAQQLWNGDLYPRWLIDMSSGLGSPTFYYYPPLPYYITSILYPLGGQGTEGWLPVALSAALASGLSGYAFHRLVQNLVSPTAALFSSLYYVFAPYHFLVDHLNRFAFAEYWSFVWMPLVLLSVRKTMTSPLSSVWVGIAASYSALLLTHLPTALLFSFVLPVLAVAVWTTLRTKPHYVPYLGLAKGLSIGLGVASIYLLPALMTQKYVSFSDTMWEGHYYYKNHFLFDTSSVLKKAANDFKASLSRFSLQGLLLSSISLVTILISTNRHLSRTGFWLFAGGFLSFFLTTKYSNPIWQAFPLLQKVQFPWRAMSSSALFDSLLLALGLHSLNHSKARRYSKAVAYCLFILISMWHIPMSINAILQSFTQPHVLNPRAISVKDYDEYKPREVSWKNFTIPGISSLASSIPQAALTKGSGSVAVVRWGPESIVLNATLDADSEIQLHQFYYPSWQAWISPAAVSGSLPTIASRDTGLLLISVPPGKYRVYVTHKRFRPEQVGLIVSACSALFLLWSLKSVWNGTLISAVRARRGR